MKKSTLFEKKYKMTTLQIAQQLIELCRAAKFNEAYQTLFAENAKSIEPDGTTAEGLAAIFKKSEDFGTAVQFVKCEVGETLVAGNYFTMVQTYHSIIKATGEKKTMQEICVYKVADGKIVEERFFY